MQSVKHIDILAITLLLAGVALVSQARQSSALRYHSERLVEFTRTQFVPKVLSPHLPKLCLTRD